MPFKAIVAYLKNTKERDVFGMANVSTELLERNRMLKDSFFENREIEREYKISVLEPLYGFIYCIENKLNGKRYIGKASSPYIGIKNPSKFSALSRRVNQYIYEYNSNCKKSPSIMPTLRPIARAMVEDGIENFIMYPVAETTASTTRRLERHFIEKFNTIENGYNVAEVEDGGPIIAGIRRKQSAAERDKRSEPIVAINLVGKTIVFAASMKLFGDYLGTSKDMIKNQARTGRSYKGWFVFYVQQDKRFEILEKVMNDWLGVQANGTNRNHSEKSKKFYRELYESVDELIKDPKHCEYFSDFVLLPDITIESMEE